MGLFGNKVSRTESAHDREYREALARYDAAQEDKQYQRDIHKFYALIKQINERYSIINALGDFSGAAGNELIKLCKSAFEIEVKIHDKRIKYENMPFLNSEPCKTLALIYEKRKEYEKAIDICIQAINAGFPEDGTKGNMRGRIARLIKKGNVPLTEEFKSILYFSDDTANSNTTQIEEIAPEYIDGERIRCTKCGATMQKRKNCWKCGVVFSE